MQSRNRRKTAAVGNQVLFFLIFREEEAARQKHSGAPATSSPIYKATTSVFALESTSGSNFPSSSFYYSGTSRNKENEKENWENRKTVRTRRPFFNKIATNFEFFLGTLCGGNSEIATPFFARNHADCVDGVCGQVEAPRRQSPSSSSTFHHGQSERLPTFPNSAVSAGVGK